MAVTQEQIQKGRELRQAVDEGKMSQQQAQTQLKNYLTGANQYEEYDETKLRNADVNLSKYGDDTSPEKIKNPEIWGGQNDKYTGEGTKNSYAAYDPEATMEGIDPNYLYGKQAKMANSRQESYIANRNDQIASALYNAGKTSMEDVANFLNTQEGFINSPEEEKQNTIYSIWKRLGQTAKENKNNNTEQQSGTTDQNNEQALQNIQKDLAGKEGQLYGKVTADETEYGNAITTQQDPYSVDRAMAESRTANLKRLQGMDSQSIAASIISGTTPYGEQAMRDLMQYNPQKYEEVQTAIKQLKGQNTINSITSGEGDVSTVINTTASDMATFAENNSNDMTSAGQILKDVKSTLASNTSASTAEEQMATIEGDMARLQNRLKNLDKEASKVFKGDVPQYIVSAYISNRTAEIQDELSILENRYNAAYNRYKTELANAQWEKEYQLKKEELSIKQEQFKIDKYATEQGIALKWAELKGTDLTPEEITQTFNSFVEMYTEGTHGGQCGAFVKKYLSQLGINLPNISSLDSKMALIDDNITEPTEGDIVIMSSPTHPENGHMAIVSSIDDDGTIHLLESNWNGDEQVHTTRTVKPGDKSVLGYYRPTAKGSTTKQSSFTRKDGTVFDLSDTPTYDSLTYDQQNIVQQLVNLNKNPSTITKRQYGDDFEKIMSAVKEINPSWTEGDYGQADKVKKERNTSSKNGSNSRNATAATTAYEMYDFADEFGNKTWKDYNAMVNWFKQRASDPKYAQLAVKVQTLASEFAGALKGGNAAPTEQEILEAKNTISTALGKGGMKAAAEEVARSLYNKNATEADNYRRVTLEKPASIWIGDTVDWMANVVGLDISTYYDYGTQLPDTPINEDVY